MNAINLGIQWDAEPDVDAALKVEQERAAQSTHGENGKKLTPAQKRDAAFAAIAQAIEENDFEKAQELLDAHPKLIFNVGNYGPVYLALMKNFDAATAKKLIERKLHMSTYYIYQHLAGAHSPSLLRYFVERCTESKETHLLGSLYTQTLKGFAGNVAEGRRKELREQRAMLESLTTNTLEKNVTEDMFFAVFTTYHSLPDIEQKQIKDLSVSCWEKSFSAWFVAFNEKTYHRSPKVSIKTFKNVLRFLRDIPNALIGWNQAVDALNTQNQRHKNFILQYFKPDQSFEESELAKICKTFHSGYRKVELPFSRSDAKKLGLTDFEMQQLGAADWMEMDFARRDGKTPPFNKIELYMPPSFVHILVKTASPASLALLESEAGKKAYWECLQEPAVFKSWCVKASQEMINAVVRACPQMLEWNDNHNNSLGHYLVFLRVESSQAFAQLVARLNHNWILQENDQGVSVKALLKGFGATDNTLNSLDKEAIKRSMKDAGIKKTRRTDPAPKRRM